MNFKNILYECAIVTLLCIPICGCFGPRIEDIPLTSGNRVYCLPPGTYVDIDGIEHVEKNNRWSFSEEDAYEYIRSLKSEKVIK